MSILEGTLAKVFDICEERFADLTISSDEESEENISSVCFTLAKDGDIESILQQNTYLHSDIVSVFIKF